MRDPRDVIKGRIDARVNRKIYDAKVKARQSAENAAKKAVSGGGGKKKTPTKPKPEPEMSKLVKSGSYYTTSKPGLKTSLKGAKGYCASLKKSKFANLTNWDLASSGEILRFRGDPAVKKFLYWSSDKAGAGKGKAILLVQGKPVEKPEDDQTARAFCVATR